MPKLPQYDQQVQVNRGIEERRASSDMFDTGRGIATFGAALGETADIMQKRAEQQDISDMHVQLSSIRADATADLQKRINDGTITNDEALAEFNGRVRDRLTEVQGSMRTRVGSEQAAANGAYVARGLQENAFSYRAAAVAQLAVDNFKAAHAQDQDTLGKDPSQLADINIQTKAILNDPNGPYANIPAEKRRELETKTIAANAYTATLSFIRNVDPIAGKKMAVEGTGLAAEVPATQRLQLQGMADEAVHAKQRDQDRAYELAKRAETDTAHRAAVGYLQNFDKPDMGGVTFARISSDPKLASHPEIVENLQGVLNQRLEKPVSSNPQVHLDMLKKINLPVGDPNRIEDTGVPMRLFSVNNQISYDDMREEVNAIEINKKYDPVQAARQKMQNSVEDDFKRSLMGGITSANGINVGAQAAYEFNQSVQAAIDRKVAAGEDPMSLLDPRSKEYMADPERLKTYLLKSKEAVSDMAAKVQNLSPGKVVDYQGVKYKFKGGDPKDPTNYEKISEAPKIDVSDAPIPSVPTGGR